MRKEEERWKERGGGGDIASYSGRVLGTRMGGTVRLRGVRWSAGHFMPGYRFFSNE